MTKQEYSRQQLTEKEMLTDKLIHTYEALDDLLFDLSHSKDFTEKDKITADKLQDSILSFVIALAKQDYRYCIPIRELDQKGICFYYDE